MQKQKLNVILIVASCGPLFYKKTLLHYILKTNRGMYDLKRSQVHGGKSGT